MRCRQVAPYAGAWIETTLSNSTSSSQHMVAPYAGAWIETSSIRQGTLDERGRALRGRVD